jgi:hypothetical protein
MQEPTILSYFFGFYSFFLFFYPVVLHLPEAYLSGEKGTGRKGVGGPVPPRR